MNEKPQVIRIRLFETAESYIKQLKAGIYVRDRELNDLKAKIKQLEEDNLWLETQLLDEVYPL